MTTLKVAILVGPDTGNEYEAIRQSLEYMGVQTTVFFIGRPMDFVQFLANDPKYAGFHHYLLSFHGVDGKFCLPVLHPDIYLEGEPKEKIGAKDIKQLAQLPNRIILTTACTLGQKILAQAFLDGGATHYLGPETYIEGNAMLLFMHRFYYEILSNHRNIKEAYTIAANMNEETRLVKLYSNDPIAE